MSHNRTQISPIPPEGYGDRFVNFITAITMSKEEAARHTASHDRADLQGSLEVHRTSSGVPRSPADRALERAEHQARKSQRDGVSEGDIPDRSLGTVRSMSADRSGGVAGSTLPVVEEAGEAASTGGRSGRSNRSTNGRADNEKDEGRGRSPATFLPVEDTTGSATGTDGHLGLPNVPHLPPLSTSPSPLEPEKSIVGKNPKQRSPSGRSPIRGYTA